MPRTSRNAREGRFLRDRFPPRKFGQYRYLARAQRPAYVKIWDYSDPAAPRLVETKPVHVERTRGGLMQVTFGTMFGQSPNYPTWPSTER